jgi:transcriptional regulator with XRE-family HTH domain
MDNFAAWLLGEMEKRGWSQSELARQTNLRPGTIGNIINGRRGRGIDSLNAIADALKVPRETVYREAGVLRPGARVDQEIEEITHLAQDLDTEDKQAVIDFINILNRLRKRKKK